MLYIRYLIIMKGKKKSGLKISIFELSRVENCISRLWPSPLPASKHPNRVKSTSIGSKTCFLESSLARGHIGGPNGGTRSWDLGPPAWVTGSIYKKKILQDPGPNTHNSHST